MNRYTKEELTALFAYQLALRAHDKLEFDCEAARQKHFDLRIAVNLSEGLLAKALTGLQDVLARDVSQPDDKNTDSA